MISSKASNYKIIIIYFKFFSVGFSIFKLGLKVLESNPLKINFIFYNIQSLNVQLMLFLKSHSWQLYENSAYLQNNGQRPDHSNRGSISNIPKNFFFDKKFKKNSNEICMIHP